MKKENAPNANSPVDQNSGDFKNLVDLLAVLTEASNRLALMETDANGALLEILDDTRDDYARFQKTATEAETALEQIALRNPAWFQGQRSVKTPYGTVKLFSSSELKIENEEATLARLELLAHKKPEFKLADYVREKKECNKETLEKLDDATLATLGIKRIAKDNFSAKPAKIDLGKAIQQSAQPEPEKQAA